MKEHDAVHRALIGFIGQDVQDHIKVADEQNGYDRAQEIDQLFAHSFSPPELSPPASRPER